METSVTIWNFLSSISTADFFGVLLAIGTVLGVTAGLTVKLYKLFDKTRRIQEENAEYKQSWFKRMTMQSKKSSRR